MKRFYFNKLNSFLSSLLNKATKLFGINLFEAKQNKHFKYDKYVNGLLVSGFEEYLNWFILFRFRCILHCKSIL